MTARTVVCLGDVMVDVVAQLPGPLAVGSDTPAPIRLTSGGSAANTAAWLARQGIATRFVGRVGDDVLGRMAVDDLAAAGVRLDVSVDPVRATGTCIVLVDSGGERTMVPAAGANSGLGDAEFHASVVDATTYVHLSAYAVFNPGSRPAAERIIQRARETGASVSVDASSSAPLVAFGPAAFLDWLTETAGPVLLFANRDEALVLAGDTGSDQKAALALALRCGEAVVKCGLDGAVWSDGSDVVTAGTQPVAAVDTTGAGDAFAAGFLAARLEGAGIDAALRSGNTLAAVAVGRTGGRPGLSGGQRVVPDALS